MEKEPLKCPLLQPQASFTALTPRAHSATWCALAWQLLKIAAAIHALCLWWRQLLIFNTRSMHDCIFVCVTGLKWASIQHFNHRWWISMLQPSVLYSLYLTRSTTHSYIVCINKADPRAVSWVFFYASLVSVRGPERIMFQRQEYVRRPHRVALLILTAVCHTRGLYPWVLIHALPEIIH